MLKYSTGLRDKVNGLEATVQGAVIGTGITFVDGGGSDDTITDSGAAFVTEGFAPGDKVFVRGSSNNDGMSGARCTGVAAGTLTFATGTVLAGEAGLAGTVLAFARGGSVKDVMKDGILRIYSGAQPTEADDATQGTLLIEITVASGAWVAGAFGNGLEFENDPLSGELEKNSDVWSGVALASGTAGWWRLCANPTDLGAESTVLPRIDGSVGSSGADIVIASTAIVLGRTYTVDEFKITLPEYYGA